jgi:hypothetical protein
VCLRPSVEQLFSELPGQLSLTSLQWFPGTFLPLDVSALCFVGQDNRLREGQTGKVGVE